MVPLLSLRYTTLKSFRLAGTVTPTWLHLVNLPEKMPQTWALFSVMTPVGPLYETVTGVATEGIWISGPWPTGLPILPRPVVR